jgi:1-acyl-sn-glycerol-3-phosphate acyltransferase
MIFLRSLLFNILFFSFTALACIVFLPVLLMPRGAILWATKTYLKGVSLIEKTVMGLTYEIRGQEHLPKEGTYIVAAKHQSAYETLKLHDLFGDPTIVLKRELINIPVFGTFLKKIDVIPINRKNKEEAMNAIVAGALRMKDNNRPIIIFPQGTRVAVDISKAEKPYKGGIVKMYTNTDIPIIPMALNTGLFWPRNSFIKRPGKVVFEFLSPIEPGLPDKKVMQALEDRIEEKTSLLMEEAKEKFPHLKKIKTTKLLSHS